MSTFDKTKLTTTTALSGSTNVPAVQTPLDPFEALVRRESSIDGTLLRFKKGKYLIGEDKTPLPDNAHLRLIADMHQIWTGWTKWGDGHVVDRAMGLVEDKFIPPVRHQLGDLDQALWEVDAKGPKDPWTFGYSIALRYLDKPEEEQLVLNLVSWGGKSAMLKLMKAYARRGAARQNMLPVVELGVGYKYYEDYGDVPQPRLDVVDWIDDPEAEAPSTNSALLKHETAATAPANVPPQAANADAVLNDLIPF